MQDEIDTRPRGRPHKSAAERQAMMTQIAQTAQQMFQSEGYAAVSMRRLANEVGCSPMTLYKYYDGKIAILHTLWAVVFRELFDALKASLASNAQPMDRLRAACQYYVRYWLEHPEHYRLVFMAEGVTQSEVSLFIDNPETVEGFAILAKCVAEAVGRPVEDPETKIKIDLVMGALHGIAHNKITISGYPWSRAELLVDSLLENIVAGPESR